jgi:hypothetical protein
LPVDDSRRTCKPDVVVIGPNFEVEGKRCTCYPDDATCGPMFVIELPASQGGTQLSCDVNCPDPAVEECHIYRNGFTTGLISAPATAFSPGDELTCACDPIVTDVCPLTPTPWCQNLQQIMCRDGQPGEDWCRPRTVDFTASTSARATAWPTIARESRSRRTQPDSR